MARGKQVVWCGDLEDKCQVCGSSFGDTMYDGPVVPGGPWGNLCRICWLSGGGQLGTGRGQEYRLQPDGKTWLKTAG